MPYSVDFIWLSPRSSDCERGNETGKLTVDHCTFYNVAKSKQFLNTNTLKGQKYLYEFNSNIFVNVSNKKIYGNMTNNATQLSTDSKNTYLFDGEFFAETNYNGDEGLQTNPNFKDAANGDFAVEATTSQAVNQTGDQRWGTWNATGIQNVKAAQQTGKFYNLQGVEVKAPGKGLYIINGKKVVIK
jgi:hypothetical protein